MDSICKRVKIIREELGLSQIEFAKRLGVTNSHISGIEKGKTVPSEALIKLMCKEYLITEAWLKAGKKPMMQREEDDQTESAIIEMFSEDPMKEVGINISHESNRVRLLWAQMDKEHKSILAQKCHTDDDRLEYFTICEKLFRDISEMIINIRMGNNEQMVFSFQGEDIMPMTLIYKDRIARDIDDIISFISTHQIEEKNN